MGAYHFDEGRKSRGWREPIELWFATIAAAVFEVVPFVHAITGDEVSGMEPSEVKDGRLGVFRLGTIGNLEMEPVFTCSGPDVRRASAPFPR